MSNFVLSNDVVASASEEDAQCILIDFVGTLTFNLLTSTYEEADAREVKYDKPTSAYLFDADDYPDYFVIEVIYTSNANYNIEYVLKLYDYDMEFDLTNGNPVDLSTMNKIYFTIEPTEPIPTQVYHEVKFYDGESLVETQSVLDNEKAVNVNIEDENFLGWFIDGEEDAFDFDTVITENLDLYAKYKEPEPVSVYHEVNFYDGESLVETQSVLDNEKATYINIDNDDFLGWFADGEEDPFDFDTIITENLDLYAKYKEPEPVYYTVTFLVDGEFYDDITILEGSLITKPENPQKVGFNFIHWYLDDFETDFAFESTTITENLTLNAYFVPIKVYIKYLNFNQSLILQREYNYGDSTIEYKGMSDDEYLGEFIGWTQNAEDNQLFTFGNAITEDIILYPVYKPIMFNIKYYENDTELIWDWLVIEIRKNSYLELPDHEERSGYTFKGWYMNPTFSLQYNFNIPITKDTDLYCYYELNCYDIQYNIDQEVIINQIPNAYYMETISLEFSFFDGYKLDFIKIYDEMGQEIDLNEDFAFIMPADNVIVEIVAKKYTLFIKSDYFNEKEVVYGENITVDDPILDDEYFLGWFLDEDLTQPFEGNVIGAEGQIITLYAKKIALWYTLTVMLVDDYKEIEIYYNQLLNLDDVEIFDLIGYDYAGLFVDEDYETPFNEHLVKGDFTLFAKYEVIYFDITFIYGKHYENKEIISVAYGQIPHLEIAKETYLRFEGWNASSAFSDCTYYAIYTVLYDNYYYFDDILVCGTIDVFSVTPSEEFDIPNKTGYIFNGFNFIKSESGKNYYNAQFSPLMYNVILDIDSGLSAEILGEKTYLAELMLIINLNQDYQIQSIEITPKTEYQKKGSNYTFTMPAEDITITIRTEYVAPPVVEEPKEEDNTPPQVQTKGDAIVKEAEVQQIVDISGGSVSLQTKKAAASSNNLNKIQNTFSALTLFSTSITIDLLHEEDGLTKNLDFKQGSTLKVYIPIEKHEIKNDGFYKVMLSSQNSNVFYDCYVEEIEGKTYVYFYADRIGTYTIAYLENDNTQITTLEIVLIITTAILVPTMIMLFVSLIKARKKSKW